MMFADQSRDALRATWRDAWRKASAQGLLTPLETQLVALIREHPEYQPWIKEADAAEPVGTSPFLHLSLHLALREQINTDRPKGIALVYQQLAARDPHHAAEHRMLEVLGSTLWDAQRAGRAPDEQAYLEALRKLR
jgi:hypothetical protein